MPTNRKGNRIHERPVQFTDYAYNYAAFKRNFTGQEHMFHRELVKGSLEVYRLGSYGALAIVVHRFYGTVNAWSAWKRPPNSPRSGKTAMATGRPNAR